MEDRPWTVYGLSSTVIHIQRLNLPPNFIQNIHNAFGDKGRIWLDSLPALVSEASRRWKLTAVKPVPNLSYNFVAFAKRPSTTPKSGSALGDEQVVLKIGVPNRELISEMATLRFFDGRGAVRLLDADEEHAMFLLERVVPGEMLSMLEDDEQATHIAADVMLKLWRSLDPNDLPLEIQKQASGLQSPFIKLTDWFSELDKLRPMFNGGTGPFPEKIILHVEETLPRLFAESSPPRLIHGDLHHFNILSSERGCAAGVMPAALRSGGTMPSGWLAIDPKGVIGHPEYEVGPFLINPMPGFLNGSNPQVQTEKRIAILSERLGFARQRLRDWGLCHAVLSAWWDMTPDGIGGEYSIHCAEVFAKIKF